MCSGDLNIHCDAVVLFLIPDGGDSKPVSLAEERERERGSSSSCFPDSVRPLSFSRSVIAASDSGDSGDWRDGRERWEAGRGERLQDACFGIAERMQRQPSALLPGSELGHAT